MVAPGMALLGMVLLGMVRLGWAPSSSECQMASLPIDITRRADTSM
jgi:hypothetical protein